jgi:two-component SAPR family response regulator
MERIGCDRVVATQTVVVTNEGVKPMPGTEEPQLTGVNILVVEDEMLVAVDYCERLAKAGAQIIGPCTSVAAALRSVAQHKIDVAVLDYALSDENSDPLQAALERRNIPYIVISGYPRVLVRRNDCQQILSKPISADRLCDTVKAAATTSR